ncbi:hypothetical protein CEUSTIGMA_g4045.t1 [Chlamydomonas eustigma]|uniref:Protein kinase domain-containing protein n=1 Tax=Chlamydomonas eustigma TaxID=1157962 RepID=A0A250X0Z2_9CHLO|nr:hypothetical protein CEUSTIGMA_g4045.t1 [Chlamydomonas eustigma]|eukprot:GAX76599.1 hypothetical protein CEUSTIGMA_g4045.t1 [Chlamydomonas eustigma]
MLSRDLTKLKLLARGGHGICYKADWRGSLVAAKIIVTESDSELQQSMIEAMTGRILAHPHVVHTYAAVTMPAGEACKHHATAPDQQIGTVSPNQCVDESVDIDDEVQEYISGTGHAFHFVQQLPGPNDVYAKSSQLDSFDIMPKRTVSSAANASAAASPTTPVAQPRQEPPCHQDSSKTWEQRCKSTPCRAVESPSTNGHFLFKSNDVPDLRLPSISSQIPTPSYNFPLSSLKLNFSRCSVNSQDPLFSLDGDVESAQGSQLEVRCGNPNNFSFTGAQHEAGDAVVIDTLDKVLHPMCLIAEQHVTVIVMEYCDRGCLAAAIKRGAFRPSGRWGSSITLRALIRTAKEIAQGLAYLHSLGITHGDLKPANVLLKSSRMDRRGFTVRISDFGMATVRGAHEPSHSGCGLGTMAYTAPEAIDDPLIPASDMWSFGILLYEMLTGEHPFKDLHWGRLLAGLLDSSLQLEWPETMDPVLRRLGQACTSYDPKKRPSSCVVSKVMSRLEEGYRQTSPGSVQGSSCFNQMLGAPCSGPV